jgi:hypothetical protein
VSGLSPASALPPAPDRHLTAALQHLGPSGTQIARGDGPSGWRQARLSVIAFRWPINAFTYVFSDVLRSALDGWLRPAALVPLPAPDSA